MRKTIAVLCAFIFILVLPGCTSRQNSVSVVATTKPVYDFTVYLCQNTNISVNILITENVSCLHDYTLQVRQMRTIESAQLIVISGAGLETFLGDTLSSADNIIDASYGITAIHDEHFHEHAESHHHETDPHIWLSTNNAKQMVNNIYVGLSEKYPEYKKVFQENLKSVYQKIDSLESYGYEQLSNLSTRNMITFHDGFAYFADQWDLTILRSLEEEAGSEASAAELIELIDLIHQHNLPAIFTEENGSTSAAQIIASETGIPIYSLNMGLSEQNYFDVMYHNIDTVKEALG